ncbi:MAG TPA: patatin-like phospholipase family protein [Bryobacteraceae bacterium]|nr:patatin-like phospholipase family protein [Bryobacteraceae bacterium]
MKTALVLSGGGMFGAWQAGAWRALAPDFSPDLIVGASVGSLNGYAIAGGATPDQLIAFWRQPSLASFRNLPATIQELMRLHPLRQDYAVVLTDLLRMKPKIFRGDEITWRHLAASCAIPGILPQQRIHGRWYSDGGLLNPLPVWGAVESGATRIIALHALPEIPGSLIKPFVKGFRATVGHNPPVPSGVDLTVIKTDGPLGSMHDALHWKAENINRWIEMGEAAIRKRI